MLELGQAIFTLTHNFYCSSCIYAAQRTKGLYNTFTTRKSYGTCDCVGEICELPSSFMGEIFSGLSSSQIPVFFVRITFDILPFIILFPSFLTNPLIRFTHYFPLHVLPASSICVVNVVISEPSFLIVG